MTLSAREFAPSDPARVPILRAVPDLFRVVAERHAGRVAIEADDARLTYADLDRLSNRVAHRLIADGGRGPVAMVCAFETATIVVMLGALKAGRPFAPIDPRDPPERGGFLRDRLGAHLVSSDLLDASADARDDDPNVALDRDHPGLVFSTSGSTGRPRAVIGVHAQLAASTVYGVGPGDRFALVVSPAFAASITPIFGTLLGGGTLCPFDLAERGIGALASWLDTAGITAIKTSPSVLRTIAATIEARGRPAASVTLAIVGGERADGADFTPIQRAFPVATIVDHYGSTEAGHIACTTVAPHDTMPPGPVPFRDLFAAQTVLIVDDEGHPVDRGQEGAIVVRGPYVALRSLADDGTEDSTVGAADGVRFARLGDRGRFLADGRLEHLGRADLLLKVRGQSVNPLVVERAIAALPSIREAVVLPAEGRDGVVRLVAHVVPRRLGKFSSAETRVALGRTLPPFMIPSTFLRMSEIPRTSRGKIDREALTRIARDAAPGRADYVPPRTDEERVLAEAAAHVLRLDRIGTADDLFDLGLDSLSAAELLAFIRDRFGAPLAATDLVAASTVAALALRVREATDGRPRTVTVLAPGGSETPLFMVAPGTGRLMFPARRLARRINRLTYAFLPHGLFARAFPDRTIERAAARYIRVMHDIQPRGPYLIAGHSFGGLVAFEIACQLRGRGEAVALLALIDPASGRRPRWEQIAKEDGADAPGSTTLPYRILRYAWRVSRRTFEAATAGIVRYDPDRWPGPFFALAVGMKRRYKPGTYDGPALVCRTHGWERYDRLDLTRSMTGATSVRLFDGNHLTLLDDVHVSPVALALTDALDAADPCRRPAR